MSALSRSILVIALALAAGLAVSACGQKGDLYLPPAQAGASAPPALPGSNTPTAPAVRR